MKLKKLLLIFILIFILTGCTNIQKMSIDDIVNSLSVFGNKPNTYRKGFRFFIPKGLSISDAGSNYVILSSSNDDYYLYFDLISYNENKKIEYQISKEVFYSKIINYDDKLGYIEINKQKNGKYLIEIMYNYAKIEVMVDDAHLKSGLANTINILKTVKYDKKVVKKMLAEDDLIQSEEVFDLFKTVKSNSDILEYVEGYYEVDNNNKVRDTDFLN